MWALSSRWATDEQPSAGKLLDRLGLVAPPALELEAAMPYGLFPDLSLLITKRRLSISSIFGLLSRRPEDRLAWDENEHFPLACLDTQRRKICMTAAKHTIEWANRFECPLVIVTLGGSESSEPAVRQGHFDAACRSLDALFSSAEREGITLTLSTPAAEDLLPCALELGALLAEFSGAPLAYDHDLALARRAATREEGAEEVDLTSLGDSLVSLGVSDLLDDEAGLLPGEGGLDFEELSELLPAPPPRVLRLAPGPAPAQVREAVAMLKQAGLVLDHKSDEPAPIPSAPA